MAEIRTSWNVVPRECVGLRVQDIDIAESQILVRNGKGAKDRMMMLPESFKVPLNEHLEVVEAFHKTGDDGDITSMSPSCRGR